MLAINNGQSGQGDNNPRLELPVARLLGCNWRRSVSTRMRLAMTGGDSSTAALVYELTQRKLMLVLLSQFSGAPEAVHLLLSTITFFA